VRLRSCPQQPRASTSHRAFEPSPRPPRPCEACARVACLMRRRVRFVRGVCFGVWGGEGDLYAGCRSLLGPEVTLRPRAN